MFTDRDYLRPIKALQKGSTEDITEHDRKILEESVLLYPVVQPQILHLDPKVTKKQLIDAWNRLEENEKVSTLIQKVQEELYNEAIAEAESRAALSEDL